MKPGGLQENRLLGTFRSGETAKLRVELTVPAELDNTYANRIGEVDWVFHLEAFQESQLTARKLWSDGNANHTGDTITVNLLRDGKIAETQELSAANGWAYTFDRLVEGHTWTVEEASVPAGYTVSYATEGQCHHHHQHEGHAAHSDPGDARDHHGGKALEQ